MNDPMLLRAVVCGAQAATLAITWPLWQAREAPAMLPLCDLPALPFAWLLLASLAVALRWPTIGAAAHTLLLALAILADQTREQPQAISLAILLWAATPHRWAASVGALHLIALWLWSGIGKLTSARFLSAGGAWLLGDSGDPGAAATMAAVSLGLAEVLLALAAMTPRWRTRAAVGAILVHSGVLVFLVGVRGANPAVWPWNAVLAIAAPLLLLSVPPRPWAVPGCVAPSLAAAAFLLLPLGFHSGFVDAPFAMQVYTMNEPRALLLRADGHSEPLGYVPDLAVPLPPVPRIQRQWFERHRGPADRLVLLEPRPIVRWLGGRDELIPPAP